MLFNTVNFLNCNFLFLDNDMVEFMSGLIMGSGSLTRELTNLL